MLETTRQKVERMFAPETRERIERAGLMVVDKADFQMVMDGYNHSVNEIRGLRIEITRLKKQLSQRNKA